MALRAVCVEETQKARKGERKSWDCAPATFAKNRPAFSAETKHTWKILIKAFLISCNTKRFCFVFHSPPTPTPTPSRCPPLSDSHQCDASLSNKRASLRLRHTTAIQMAPLMFICCFERRRPHLLSVSQRANPASLEPPLFFFPQNLHTGNAAAQLRP